MPGLPCSRASWSSRTFRQAGVRGVCQVLEQILKLHRHGHTVVVATHDVEKAITHADRVAIMYRGELKAVGPPEAVIPELLQYNVRPPCFSLFGEEPVSWLID